MILHVVDCSNPQMDMQMHVVRETLRDLEIVDKTIEKYLQSYEMLTGEKLA